MKRHIPLIVMLVSLPAYAQEENARRPAAQLIENAIEIHGIEMAMARFNELLATEDTSLSETELVSLGHKLLRSGKPVEALEVFKMAAEVFPESPQVYFALARGYRVLRMMDKDLQSVERAFQLRDKALLKDYLAKNKESLAKTAEEVIEKHLAAVGGKSKVLQIKTMAITYSDLNAIDQAAFIKRYFQYPFFVRQDFLSTGTSRCTDGNRVWKKEEGWVEQPNDNMVYMPDIYADFIDYTTKGISYGFLGVVAIDGETLYHLQKSYKDGEKRDYYFSTETDLFVMERRIFGAGKDIKRYFDYRTVEGILIPHMFIVTNKAGLGHHHGGIIKDIELNIPLDDAFFPVVQ